MLHRFNIRVLSSSPVKRSHASDPLRLASFTSSAYICHSIQRPLHRTITTGRRRQFGYKNDNLRIIQPWHPLDPLPSFVGPDDPSLSTLLRDEALYQYMKGLYKRGWGVMRRDDVMDPDEQERAKVVRGVALSKAFWFRREADSRVGRTDNERSDGAPSGMPDVTSDVVRDMDDFMERLARSKWASYPSQLLDISSPEPNILSVHLSSITSRQPSPLTLPRPIPPVPTVPTETPAPLASPIPVSVLTFRELVVAYAAEEMYERYLSRELELVNGQPTRRDEGRHVEVESLSKSSFTPAITPSATSTTSDEATLPLASPATQPSTDPAPPITTSTSSPPNPAIWLGHQKRLERPYKERPHSLDNLVRFTGCVEVAPEGWELKDKVKDYLLRGQKMLHSPKPVSRSKSTTNRQAQEDARGWDGVELMDGVRDNDGQSEGVIEQEGGSSESHGDTKRSGSGLGDEQWYSPKTHPNAQPTINDHSNNPPQNAPKNSSKKSRPNPNQRRAQARRRIARRDPSLAPPLLHIPSEEETRAADARALMRLMARSVGKEV